MFYNLCNCQLNYSYLYRRSGKRTAAENGGGSPAEENVDGLGEIIVNEVRYCNLILSVFNISNLERNNARKFR
jgi:hypothetical protein